VPIINSIQIRNFKGAADVSLSLAGKIATPVVTLIGLNESGKTTILEGLSYFVSNDSSVSEIFEGVHSPSAISGLIPIHQKAAFNGDISIIADVSLTPEDALAAALAGQEGDVAVEIKKDTLTKNFKVVQTYKFVDSVNTDSKRIWHVGFEGWPAPGSEDTELGVLMEPEVRHGEAKVYAGVQA